jgi:pimeloyl-ACP methyl ester carboxylesterase
MGGFLSVAYAAEGAQRVRVVDVVNFVGGWVAQAEDRCPVDYNSVAFKRYGIGTRIPELWMYGAADPYNTAASINEYRSLYASGGGGVQFEFVQNVPGNGRALPEHPGLWRERVNAYLSGISRSSAYAR